MFSRIKNIIILFIILLLYSYNSWSQTTPPSLTAIGNEPYCPLTQIPIVTDFNITNPDNVAINTVYIQISEGYINGQDKLELTGNHPNIASKSFNTLEGKLELDWTGAGIPNDAEIIAAVKDIVFESNSASPSGNRIFSITIGEANYLPSTGHYYEYVSASEITWGDAKKAAETNGGYYGLQGYLATLTSPEEAQLAGEQASGQGWIGGSDEETEGVWKWVTGPEGLNGGMIFWNGLANGSSPPGVYTNWHDGEPNDWPDANIPGQENYAHVYEDGKWNDYPNYNASIKGYIVEYGWPGDDPLDFTTFTDIYIPVITNTLPYDRCGPGNITLEATASSGDVFWYTNPTSGTKIHTGTNFSTTIAATTTYYVLASENGCETGARTPIIATIKPIPTVAPGPNNTICGAGSGVLTATSSAGIINWYNAAVGGVSLGTGTSFTTPVISTTTTYYIDATDNGCTTTSRSPIALYVQYTNPPLASSLQTFCDIENATLSDLTITGTAILWYAAATGGIPLNTSEILVDNTTYYATQTLNSCESPTRATVIVFVHETVAPLLPTDIPVIEECDSLLDNDDTNGFTEFYLTENNTILLNGKNNADFTFSYFTDPTYSTISEILNPLTFINTVKNGQPIYVRIANNLDNSCYTDSSFEIQVNSLPVIQSSVTLKNCDEDGTPDGYTDFNLTEADSYITNGDDGLIVTYYLTYNEADLDVNPVNPSPFNNQDAINNEVFARAENTFGCHRVATVTLEVSTTHFPIGYMYYLETCDADNTIDGFETFDLTLASADIINQFPTGQNLSVHYFRNLTDAQLKENEILPQDSYINESPFLQVLYVRVQSEDNGDCFGVGPHLTLTIYPRPEFEVNPTEIVCLNLPPITLAPYNAQGIYTYEWFNEAGTLIPGQPTVSVAEGGVYTVIATSGSGCVSFPQTVTVTESIIASITMNDITITDDSENNTITLNTTNLGIGDYEFALDNSFGPYQDEPVFEMVSPGIHTVFVQDKNNCGIASIEVSVIGFPKFFTPNNDGYNDYWQILGVSADFYPTSLIYIFDRFGKLITQIDTASNGWDGTYQGKQLTSSDYWFTAQLIDDEGNVKEKKGHFSLIR